MKINELALEICKREKGKAEVNVAQVKEILKVLQDIVFKDGPLCGSIGVQSTKFDMHIFIYRNLSIKTSTAKKSKKKVSRK